MSGTARGELQDCTSDEVEAFGDTVWAASGPHANTKAPTHDTRRNRRDG